MWKNKYQVKSGHERKFAGRELRERLAELGDNLRMDFNAYNWSRYGDKSYDLRDMLVCFEDALSSYMDKLAEIDRELVLAVEKANDPLSLIPEGEKEQEAWFKEVFNRQMGFDDLDLPFASFDEHPRQARWMRDFDDHPHAEVMVFLEWDGASYYLHVDYAKRSRTALAEMEAYFVEHGATEFSGKYNAPLNIVDV